MLLLVSWGDSSGDTPRMQMEGAAVAVSSRWCFVVRRHCLVADLWLAVVLWLFAVFDWSMTWVGRSLGWCSTHGDFFSVFFRRRKYEVRTRELANVWPESTGRGNAQWTLCAIRMKARVPGRGGEDSCDHGLFRGPLRLELLTGWTEVRSKSDDKNTHGTLFYRWLCLVDGFEW